jgi:hypothetical protein
MSVQFSGGCACGAIRYQCSAEPVGMLNCHCRDCQRAAGGPFGSVIIVPLSAVEILSGSAKYHTVTADSGNLISRGFCPECGSPLFVKLAALPNVCAVHGTKLAGCKSRHQVIAEPKVSQRARASS